MRTKKNLKFNELKKEKSRHPWLMPTFLLTKIAYSAAFKISSILIAEKGMRVPGPKIAATPAL